MFDFIQVKYTETTQNLKVTCCNCQTVTPIHRAWANLLGKAFKSYYCETCKNKIKYNISRA